MTSVERERIPVSPRQGAVCGIADYRKLRPLPHVSKDVDTVSRALRRTGFNLNDEHILRNVRTAKEVFEWLTDLFGTTEPNAVYFIHFCGHGARVSSYHVLCTGDFDCDGPDTHEYTAVLNTKLQGFIRNRNCSPRLVVVSIDACNEFLQGVQWGSFGPASKPPCNTAPMIFLYGSEDGHIVRACSAGGHFSNALADVIDPKHPATTLTDAIGPISALMSAFCRQYGHEVQELRSDTIGWKNECGKLHIFSDKMVEVLAPTIAASGVCADGLPRPADPPFVEMADEDRTIVKLCIDITATMEMTPEGKRTLKTDADLIRTAIKRMQDLLERLEGAN